MPTLPGRVQSCSSREVRMSIWFRPTTIEQVNALFAGVRDINLHLDLRLTEIGDDFLRGTLPVDERTRQPFGLLHGGASVVLAETLGSVASNLVVDSTQVSRRWPGDHRKSPPFGTIRARDRHRTAGPHRRPLAGLGHRDPRRGRRLTCVSRLTMAVIASAATTVAEKAHLMQTPYPRLSLVLLAALARPGRVRPEGLADPAVAVRADRHPPRARPARARPSPTEGAPAPGTAAPPARTEDHRAADERLPPPPLPGGNPGTARGG